MANAAATATCPDCGRRIVLRSQPRVGEEVICPHCEADLEVVSLDPLELDWAWIEPAGDQDVDDDWDDED
jgi:alpha-aminoadipate carrier protein LysW